MAQVRQRRTQAERTAQTRRVLLEAAIALLYKRGYGATNGMLIAQKAGVSRGAMLHQFRTTADLMAFVVESVYEEELERYKEMLPSSDNPEQRLLAYPEAVWKVLSRPSGIAVLEILQGTRSDKVLAKKLRPVQARIEADAHGRAHEASWALMRLIVWAVRGLSVAKVLAPDPNSVPEAIQLLRELMRAGLETGALSLDSGKGRKGGAVKTSPRQAR